MKIEIKYFGLIAEAIEKSTENLELEKGSTVQDLLDQIKERYPNLENKSFKVAINQNLMTTDYLIQENDEIALLPPFAGG